LYYIPHTFQVNILYQNTLILIGNIFIRVNTSRENLKVLVKAVYRILSESRIYSGGNDRQGQISTEYELTPEEILTLKGMTSKERTNFALRKLKQARRDKGQCISGGPKCEPPPVGSDGKPGPYCLKHLESFRASRERLTKKRGSCARCPNPPLPGKKLCQSCVDELKLRREKALEQGICIKCFQKPSSTGLQVCKTCADDKANVEKVRRITNPESEKERIKKRDAEYRKRHASDILASQKYRRQKHRASEIGWDIEETK
jgi:hypothetical protein